MFFFKTNSTRVYVQQNDIGRFYLSSLTPTISVCHIAPHFWPSIWNQHRSRSTRGPQRQTLSSHILLADATCEKFQSIETVIEEIMQVRRADPAGSRTSHMTCDAERERRDLLVCTIWSQISSPLLCMRHVALLDLPAHTFPDFFFFFFFCAGLVIWPEQSQIKTAHGLHHPKYSTISGCLRLRSVGLDF